MGQISLVATDMDGTLLDADGAVPPGFEEWVLDHPGVRMVIASGRQVFTLQEQFCRIRDRLVFIADNGSVVVEGGELLLKDVMRRDSVEACLKIAGEVPGCTVVMCGLQGAYVSSSAPAQARSSIAQYYTRRSFVPSLHSVLGEDEVVKLALFFHKGRPDDWWQRLEGIPSHLKVVASSEKWVDIANASANKGAAIKAVQRRYGIDPADCMAFGDYLNDVELLRACGESYCMENGVAELKAVAKHIAPPNTDNGVMTVLATVG